MVRVHIYHPIDWPGQSLVRVLQQCGMVCTAYTDHAKFLYTLEYDRPEVVICAWKASAERLQSLYEDIRRVASDIPCLIISARQSGLERVLALQSGVNRYYIEPCPYSRIIFDIGALSYGGHEHELQYAGAFTLDLATQSIHYHGTLLSLSRRQYTMLALFIRRANQIISRTVIWEEIWGLETYPDTNTVDALVYRLRKRLPLEVRSKLKHIYGIGYILSTKLGAVTDLGPSGTLHTL